ncbi:Ig-like domain-containing protein [Actinoplanes utahensis]|uniref:Ig-like domain-containing protein n=1 Tax=Actinoplanes utahensis TaxID=1869 RepID=UPI00068C4812|nr:Ig-like domain-containing protein [Actinoplanes utahensis]GIF29642.1 hypothetical protein Aut01nite_26280 [Actinoplanes utahensis]
MGTKRIGAAALAALTGTTVLTFGTAAPSLADTSDFIKITSVGDMLVDGVHDRVFITDWKAGKVLATDYSGKEVGSALVDNATNLALSTDSSQLYVTSPSGQAVVALDTVTLAQKEKLSTGGVAPMDVAVAGGRIWFSYRHLDGTTGNLGTIDPSAETPTAVLDRFKTGYPGISEIALASASAAPNRLGVATHTKSAILEVSGDTATTVASVATNLDVGDLAMSPDGNRIATVIGEDYAVTLRDVGDMAAARSLTIDPYPVAVDFAGDGTLATGSSIHYDGVDLQTFTAAGETINKIENVPGKVQAHGVAWEPDGDRLFSLTMDMSGDVSLSTSSSVKFAASQIILADTPSAVPGAPITVAGRLTSTVSLPTGTVVSISRSGTGLGTAAVGPDGAFTFTDSPPAADKATYEVSYAGDGNHAPATATTSVGIARVAANLTLSSPSTAIPGAAITIAGSITSTVSLPAGTKVAVTRGQASLGTIPVTADGTFAVTNTLPAAEGKLTYQFSYAGASTHLPSTATATVNVSRKASVLKLSGPASAPRAKALTISGSLTSPLSLPAGAKVWVTRTDLDSPAGVSLGLKPVWSNGGFAFTDTPQAGGTVTYRVSYAGDATRAPALAAKAIAVSRAAPAMSLNNHGRVYAYGQTVAFTAHLGTTYKNRTVEIWADPAGNDQARRLVKRVPVNSAGNIAASLQLTRNTTVSAVFTGDARYAPRTVTATVGTRVAVSVNPVSAYGTKKISGITYYAYRDTKYATLDLYVGNNRSTRNLYFVMQEYVNGKWQTVQTEYFLGDERLYMRGTGLAGVRMRAAAAYISGTSGDSLNVTTWSPYRYFTFTK